MYSIRTVAILAWTINSTPLPTIFPLSVYLSIYFSLSLSPLPDQPFHPSRTLTFHSFPTNNQLGRPLYVELYTGWIIFTVFHGGCSDETITSKSFSRTTRVCIECQRALSDGQRSIRLRGLPVYCTFAAPVKRRLLRDQRNNPCRLRGPVFNLPSWIPSMRRLDHEWRR